MSTFAFGVAVLLLLVGIGAPRLMGGRSGCCWGRQALVVSSGSMSPSVRAGDLVVIRRLGPSDVSRVRVGRVVTFRVPGHESMVVTHRVVSVRRAASGSLLFTTKGDANAAADSFEVGQDQLIGELTWSAHAVGRVLVNLSSRRVLALLVLSLLLGVLAVELGSRVRREHDLAAHVDR